MSIPCTSLALDPFSAQVILMTSACEIRPILKTGLSSFTGHDKIVGGEKHLVICDTLSRKKLLKELATVMGSLTVTPSSSSSSLLTSCFLSFPNSLFIVCHIFFPLPLALSIKEI